MQFTQFYEGSKNLGRSRVYGDDITLLKDGNKFFQFIWGDGLKDRWKIEITRQVYHKLIRTGKDMVRTQGWKQVV